MITTIYDDLTPEAELQEIADDLVVIGARISVIAAKQGDLARHDREASQGPIVRPIYGRIPLDKLIPQARGMLAQAGETKAGGPELAALADVVQNLILWLVPEAEEPADPEIGKQSRPSKR